MAQVLHQQRQVARHGTFALLAVVGQGGRCWAVTIAAQVGQDQPEMSGQLLRHALPHHMSLWEAMQQQQRRRADAAADADVQLLAFEQEVLGLEALKPRAGVRCCAGICLHGPGA
jgi:hypothetical protein